MNAGRDFSIKSLQNTDDYSEQSHSAGIAAATGGIAASADKGKINSDYQSTADQSGIYAGKGGFNINVGKNTDLKGAVIDSDAAPDKNKLSTDTLTYSDIANKASYDSKNTGINYNTGKDVGAKDKGLTPDIGTEAKGNAGGTTKSAIAPGTIDIRSNPGQDISGLSRDTKDALNQLGKIFDKEKVKEQQELARLFGEQIFKAIGDLGLKDGSPEKTALDAFAGGLMSKLGGSSFTAGAAGVGINELVINELAKIKDPVAIQWASAIAGTAAAKIVGGTARTGAGAAVSQTKNNFLSHEQVQVFEKIFNDIISDPEKSDEEKEKQIAALLKEYYILDLKQYGDSYYNKLKNNNNDVWGFSSTVKSQPDLLVEGLVKIYHNGDSYYEDLPFDMNNNINKYLAEHETTLKSLGITSSDIPMKKDTEDNSSEFDWTASVLNNMAGQFGTLPVDYAKHLATNGELPNKMVIVGIFGSSPAHLLEGSTFYADWQNYSGKD